VFKQSLIDDTEDFGINYIYSKYNISPDSCEVRKDDFKICDFSKNCVTQKGLKIIYIRLTYKSSPAITIQKSIESVFKINLECGEENNQKYIYINNIVRIKYLTSKIK